MLKFFEIYIPRENQVRHVKAIPCRMFKKPILGSAIIDENHDNYAQSVRYEMRIYEIIAVLESSERLVIDTLEMYPEI